MPVPCPRCNRPVADGKALCMYCGASVVKMEPCPHCKVKNPATVTTCQYCHRAMRAAPAAAPSSAMAAGLRSLEILEAGVRKQRFAEEQVDAAGEQLLRQAIAHQRRNEPDAAMEAVLAALAQFPGDPAAWLIFGSVFLACGDAPSAMRCAQLGLMIAPQSGELARFRSDVEAELRRVRGRT